MLDSTLYNRAEGGAISKHDRLIGQRLAEVLCGGETSRRTTVSEDRIRELAREAFVDLCREEKSRERMRHMLEHGRPLRN